MCAVERRGDMKYTQCMHTHTCTQVIAQLQLEKCRHTVIGNVLNRGISGGQAKRVNIGLALIPKPKVTSNRSLVMSPCSDVNDVYMP